MSHNHNVPCETCLAEWVHYAEVVLSRTRKSQFYHHRVQIQTWLDFGRHNGMAPPRESIELLANYMEPKSPRTNQEN